MDKNRANKAGIDKVNLSLILLFLLTDIFYQIIIRQIKSFISAKVTIAGICT